MSISTKNVSILCGIFTLLLGCALWQVDALQGQNAVLVRERDEALTNAMAWEKTAALCARNSALLQGTSRACLEREQEGVATAELWQDILDKAQSRDTTTKERQGVPDDTTRRKLCIDLDHPL